MEVLIFILIIIFCIVSVGEAVTTGSDNDADFFKIIFFVITTILCTISIFYESLKLRDIDVFKGRAEYVETIHISEGDTIKTYHIQLKK